MKKKKNIIKRISNLMKVMENYEGSPSQMRRKKRKK